jgi:hypothetical protein
MVDTAANVGHFYNGPDPTASDVDIRFHGNHVDYGRSLIDL